MASLDNTSRRWNRFWNNSIKFQHSMPFFKQIDNFTRKKSYFNLIDNLIGNLSLKNQNILELGSGTGRNSFHIANLHKSHSVTLLDFSKEGLDEVKENLCNCKVIKINKDVMKFYPKKKYDLVHSTGLAEHFYKENRFKIIRKHAELAKKNGLVMIMVPIISPVFKIVGKINRWQGIREIPFTEKELHLLCEKSNLKILREGKTGLGVIYGILARKIK